MSTSTDLVIIPELESSKDLAVLDTARALTLRETFTPFFVDLKTLAAEAKEIAVNQPVAAKAMRLKLRKVRTTADKARAKAGEDALTYKRSVDGLYKLLESHLEPIETRMENVEKAEQIAAKEKADALKAARLAELTPLATVTSSDLTFYDLAGMPESQYLALLKSTREAAEAKLALTKKAEEDRIAAEAARVKREADLAAENARLAKEAAEAKKAKEDADRVAAEERKKADAEKARLQKEADARLAAQQKAAQDEAARVKKANDEKAAKEKAERDAEAKAAQAKRDADNLKARQVFEAEQSKAKIERDRLAVEAEKARAETQRLAAADKARRDAEAAKLAADNLAAQTAAKAPDKAKLGELAKSIRALPLPTLKTNGDLSIKIKDQTERFAKWVESEAAKL